MRITSPAFENNTEVPTPNTCLGSNVNPPLNFEDIPFETKSLVLIVEDTDATPEPWIHWLVFNIPPSTMTVGEGSLPTGGTEGHANGGTPGYEGPCPKYFSGTHRYHFKLYALDTVLELPTTASKKEVAPAMEGHVLDEAVLVGLCIGPEVPTA